MRAPAAAIIALVVALILSGCQRAVEGTAVPGLADDEIAQYQVERGSAEALESALDRLASRPVMRYEMASADRLTWTVTSTGAVYAAGTSDGRPVRAMAADGQLFMVADARRWESFGLKREAASTYAGRWTRVLPADVGFDPARALTPKAVAASLREAVADRSEDGYARDGQPIPVLTRTPDGTEVYRIETLQGALEVTTAEPHRVTHTDIPLVRPGKRDLLGLSGGGDTRVREGDRAQLAELRGSIEDVLGGLRSAYGFQPSLRLVPGRLAGTCGTDGTCTAKAPVRNRIGGDYPPSTSVEVTMKVTMSAKGLGTRECGQPRVAMRPNTQVDMSCGARFALPRSKSARSYPVKVRAAWYAVAKYRPDRARLLGKVRKDFDELARGL